MMEDLIQITTGSTVPSFREQDTYAIVNGHDIV